MIRKLGVDLGSWNTKIYDKDKGIALRVPTAAAVEVQTNKPIAFGQDARRMYGKTPPSLRAYRPVQGGVVAEPEAATRMLRHYFRKLEAVSVLHRPDVTVSVPCRINEVERRAIEDTVYDAGARQVFIIEAPLAGALGANLNITGPRGCMVVDIGAGCTGVAVMSMDSTVVSDSVRVGGLDLDRAIIQFIRKKYDLLIGEPAAEALKLRIGTAWQNFDRGAAEVPGRDLGGGLTGVARISSADVCEAMQERLGQIISLIKSALDETPTELASDIYEAGIVLVGGTAQLDGLPELIQRRLGIKANIAKTPADCVCNGLGWCMNHEDAAQKHLKYRA